MASFIDYWRVANCIPLRDIAKYSWSKKNFFRSILISIRSIGSCAFHNKRSRVRMKILPCFLKTLSQKIIIRTDLYLQLEYP